MRILTKSLKWSVAIIPALMATSVLAQGPGGFGGRRPDGATRGTPRTPPTAAQLGQKIVDAKTKEYFIHPVNDALEDVDNFLLPNARKSTTHSRIWMDAAEFRLEQAEASLKFAQEMISKYGTSLQLVG